MVGYIHLLIRIYLKIIFINISLHLFLHWTWARFSSSSMWTIDSSLQSLNIKLRYWRALEVVVNARSLGIDALPFAYKQGSF